MCSADPATCEKSGPLSMFVGWDSGRRRSTRVTSSRPLHSTVTRSVDTHLKPQEKVTGLAGSAVQHRDSTYATCFFNSAPHMTNISTLISCLIHLLLYTHLFKHSHLRHAMLGTRARSKGQRRLSYTICIRSKGRCQFQRVQDTLRNARSSGSRASKPKNSRFVAQYFCVLRWRCLSVS